MSLDELYPTVEPGSTVYLRAQGSELLCGTEAHPCLVCKSPTRWLEISFEGPLCSPECVAAQWEEYFDAVRKAPT